MNEGARVANEEMYRKSMERAAQSIDEKLDRIIELLEQILSCSREGE